MSPDRPRIATSILLSILAHASFAMLGGFRVGITGLTTESLSVSITAHVQQDTPETETSQDQPYEATPPEDPPVAEPQQEVAPPDEEQEIAPKEARPVSRLVKKPKTPPPVVQKPDPVKPASDAIEKLASSKPMQQDKASIRGIIAITPDVSAIPLYHLIPKPPYPSRSRDLGEAGTVIISILVAADGSVADAYISKSSGYSLLDGSALSTVKTKWRFRPATNIGKPVASWVRAPINFNIR